MLHTRKKRVLTSADVILLCVRISDEMEKTIDNFKSANSKLKDILDETGHSHISSLRARSSHHA